MSYRVEVLPFLGVALVLGVLVVLVARLFKARWSRAVPPGVGIAVIMALYLLYFFRDPERISPEDPSAIVAAADGRIAGIVDISGEEFTRIGRHSGLTDEQLLLMSRLSQTNSVRISIFLSLIDVHVNRAPIAGSSRFLGYFPGQRYFTFQDKSSTENQHNAIFIQNDQTCCLINQIVGPVARRVVYWPTQDTTIDLPLKMGERIGMMKFGSRLDMYFPKDDIVIKIKKGDTVAAGTSVIAELRKKE